MVGRFIKLLHREIRGLHEAAYLLALFALLSQFLGLLRDRLLAASFGAGETLDLYYASFRIPDLILVSAASVVSVAVLIPFLVERLEKGRERGAAFVNEIFTVFFVSIVAVSAGAFFLAPVLLTFLFPTLFAAKGAVLVSLTRLMLLQPLFLGLSNLFATVTQVYKRFFVYALSPILYNAGIIFGVLALYPSFGLPGLALGVILGAFFHCAIQIPVALRAGLFPRLTARVNWRDIRTVFLISIPRTAALSVGNIAVLFLVSLASRLATGSIAIFNFAWNLQSVPLSIIGASYSLAAFPTLVGHFTGGKRADFIAEVSASARHIIFWSLPALVFFIVLRAQIVRVILGFGRFNWSDTRLTAAALALFALSAVAQSLVLLFVRAFYAKGDTKTPLFINMGAAALVILFGYGFMKAYTLFPQFQFFLARFLKVEGVSGSAVVLLPLAYSLATILNAAFLWRALARVFIELHGALSRALWESGAASLLGGAVSYGLLHLLDGVFNLNKVYGIFLQGFLAGLGGVFISALALFLFGNREIREAAAAFHSKILRAKIIAPDASEIEHMRN